MEKHIFHYFSHIFTIFFFFLIKEIKQNKIYTYFFGSDDDDNDGGFVVSAKSVDDFDSCNFSFSLFFSFSILISSISQSAIDFSLISCEEPERPIPLKIIFY